MSSILVRPTERRVIRRVVRARCQAVSMAGFRLVGERVLDASTDGLLLACDDGVEVGEELVVSFQMPRSGAWYDAEAYVTRVIDGYREHDPGYAAGLRFTQIDRISRLSLGADLHDQPIATPARRLRTDYARTVLSIFGA